ncbi:MAG: hypothetical protein HYV26_17255 [Candidatus Hydrogenedentes bacterium]|nr:hypothetical protein [Candidatus Hydrogenedentota bacterium]MBI3119106.1 hypothetical protein [Candidatus Hydrogenedentota bacterium]
MSPAVYLIVMLSVITLVLAISVPVLFLQKCPACGKRNSLDARHCKGCGGELPNYDE